jgi:CRISPR-associated protein Cmr4
MPSLLFVHALSPLHAGTGHAVGAVDLPIARDRATGFPYLPGSSIKGVLRDGAREWDKNDVANLFGPERDNASAHAGALMVGDASLLLLPARSVVGTFAWVTSPWLLRRLARDARESGQGDVPIPEPASVERATVTKEAKIKSGDKVIFEDLDFVAAVDDKTTALAEWIGKRVFPDSEPDAATWRRLLAEKLCVVHDDAMAYFAEHGTDVVTRIALDPDLKTVKSGALWTEESLPSETVLVSLVAGQSNGKLSPAAALDRLTSLTKHPLQFGGNATIGRGRCRLALVGGTR